MSILTDDFLGKYKGKQPRWGFNGLGEFVFRRTYSRLKNDGKREEWWETVARCVEGAQKIGAGYTQDEAQMLYDKVFSLKCNFSGRSLWQLGTRTVDSFGANSLINCFYVAITRAEDFCFIFENLMLGAGVGFSVRREHIHELPKIKHNVVIAHECTKDADFIVPDSRQGWIELLRRVLDSYFIGGKPFVYSTILVRGYGEPIKGFGGTASGPAILIEGIGNICKVLSSRYGKKLRSIDVLDICNIIGSVVVAGNVRRSSEIAIGDADDHLFLKAKRWDLGEIPNWRAMSNNTIAADDFSYISGSVWEGYNGNGEPYGLINVPLSQKYGRLADGPMKGSGLYPMEEDPATGGNPCNEISLESYESCNLGELYLNNIESEEELTSCASLLYKTQKAICALNYISTETNEVVHRNFRLGLGVTGICQSLDKLDWLNGCYKALRALDKEWSKKRGWPESIKLTTCKPSGTLSLLAGATPGIHPAFAAYYIRRVRVSSEDALVKHCKDNGYKVEYVRNFDHSEDRKTMVVEFPCQSVDSVLAKDMTAVQQLELVKKIQTVWSDNSISVTVYYRKEEIPAIKEWLKEHYQSSLKTVSFLLHQDHGFQQSPYEEISEALYMETIRSLKSESAANLGGEMLDLSECIGGSCPIR